MVSSFFSSVVDYSAMQLMVFYILYLIYLECQFHMSYKASKTSLNLHFKNNLN